MARQIDTIINEIIEYFENDEELFNDCLEDFDSITGYLYDDRYYPMDYLIDKIRCASIDTLITIIKDLIEGSDEYGKNFNMEAKYYKGDIYHYYISSDERDYLSYLDNPTIVSMCRKYNQIWEIMHTPKLQELFEELYELVD